MKKMKRLLLLLIPIFFMVLSGCSSLSIKTTKNDYQASGLVAVVKGKATKANKVTYTLNGVTTKLKTNAGHFAFSVPVSSNDQDIKLVASDGNETSTKIVTVSATRNIGDYTAFAQEYNYNSLIKGIPVDQLPLVAQDGIFKYTRTNGTVMYFNVQGSYLMGVSMVGKSKDLKSKAGLNNFENSLFTIAQLTGANGKKVVKDLNRQFKDVNNGSKTTMKQITSNGLKFDINMTSEGFYLYITK